VGVCIPPHAAVSWGAGRDERRDAKAAHSVGTCTLEPRGYARLVRSGEQITELDEFRRALASEDGVIVIQDRVRPAPIAHRPRCVYVKERWFIEKILSNYGKNGRYYWFTRVESARSRLGADPCSTCLPG